MYARAVLFDPRAYLISSADGPVTRDDDIDVVRHVLEQLQPNEVVLDRAMGADEMPLDLFGLITCLPAGPAQIPWDGPHQQTLRDLPWHGGSFRLRFAHCSSTRTSDMSDETWDGHRAVTANSGERQFRVRGNRRVDTNTGVTSFRVCDEGRVVDADSGETVYRLRD